MTTTELRAEREKINVERERLRLVASDISKRICLLEMEAEEKRALGKLASRRLAVEPASLAVKPKT